MAPEFSLFISYLKFKIQYIAVHIYFLSLSNNHKSNLVSGFGATIKKTFGLGKSSENRRRRDGLPPSSVQKTRPVSSYHNDLDDSYATIASTPSVERDSESLGSHDSAERRRGSGNNYFLISMVRDFYTLKFWS